MRKANAQGGVRPFDPYRDLEPVTELISVAFGDRLDPVGQLALAQMRRLARRGPLERWLLQPAWSLEGIIPGFVWVEDERVVGNVSLRRALVRGGFHVGNVSVHPEWRRRGIAQALMKAALEEISARRGRWVGLEVRTGNSVAQRLYESLGFREVGRTSRMICEAGLSRLEDPPASCFRLRRGRSRDGKALVGLVRASVPEPLRPLLELREQDYRPGWERTVDCWLSGRRETWWVADDRGTICGGVRALRERGHRPNSLEVLVSQEHAGDLETLLVQRGMASLRSVFPRMTEAVVVYPAEPMVSALKSAGFQESCVLIQMVLDLTQRVPVRDVGEP
jgi:ribosomal protein S18 acetylase RimI-like enzyme